MDSILYQTFCFVKAYFFAALLFSLAIPKKLIILLTIFFNLNTVVLKLGGCDPFEGHQISEKGRQLFNYYIYQYLAQQGQNKGILTLNRVVRYLEGHKIFKSNCEGCRPKKSLRTPV